MVSMLKASEILNEKKISAKVVNIHTIKPIDKKVLKMLIKRVIFTVEEHNIIVTW